MNITANISSLQANQTRMDINANNVANVNTDGFRPSDGRVGNNLQVSSSLMDDTGSLKSQTDLTKEIPDQMVATNITEVNVTAIKTQDEMMGTLLDIKA
jgi:flagellar hook protein FlgE